MCRVRATSLRVMRRAGVTVMLTQVTDSIIVQWRPDTELLWYVRQVNKSWRNWVAQSDEWDALEGIHIEVMQEQLAAAPILWRVDLRNLQQLLVEELQEVINFREQEHGWLRGREWWYQA
ncbi:hypothetical protein R1sor_011971 [Riccia sorocarpa]|uniref:Uncharacterized protein n=1 Tax=Riccia sorocarpa TaxID=122646 RepID=A0ABD3I6A5_9MARC